MVKEKKGKPFIYENVTDPNLETSIKVRMNHPSVKQNIWKKFYRVNSYKSSIEDGLALEIGLKILSSGTSSLLYENLVNKKKIFSYWRILSRINQRRR